jgi:pilus assembly protein CpaF
MDALSELAEAPRHRLIERARDGGDGGGGIEAEVRALVEQEASALDADDRDALVERVNRLASGLGPLEPLLDDPEVDEVMVNGPRSVWVERRGRLERAGVSFGTESELSHAIERILAPLGRRVDEAAPLCDARLADGSRVNVVIPPLSLEGPCLTVRKFRRQGFALSDLEGNGTLTPELRRFLADCVRARASILVSGGTGSGKTTTLNALSGAIPSGERIVTIEDAAELRLRQRHVIRLEARPPNLEERGEVTIRQLVRNALRMRPDRIVVGEVRGAEALDSVDEKAPRASRLAKCVLCGVSLDGRRRGARHCSAACRAEASRLRAILSGRGSGPYSSVASRLSAMQKRTRSALDPSTDQERRRRTP